MRKAIQILVGLMLVLPSFAYAGSIIGKVQILYTMYYGDAQDQAVNIALLRIAGAITGKPACNTQGEWAFSLKDPSGRAVFAQLLHAQSSGLDVSVIGDGTCGTWGDRERYSTYMWFTNSMKLSLERVMPHGAWAWAWAVLWAVTVLGAPPAASAQVVFYDGFDVAGDRLDRSAWDN